MFGKESGVETFRFPEGLPRLIDARRYRAHAVHRTLSLGKFSNSKASLPGMPSFIARYALLRFLPRKSVSGNWNEGYLETLSGGVTIDVRMIDQPTP